MNGDEYSESGLKGPRVLCDGDTVIFGGGLRLISSDGAQYDNPFVFEVEGLQELLAELGQEPEPALEVEPGPDAKSGEAEEIKLSEVKGKGPVEVEAEAEVLPKGAEQVPVVVHMGLMEATKPGPEGLNSGGEAKGKEQAPKEGRGAKKITLLFPEGQGMSCKTLVQR